jgi:hypothetical protein
MAASMNFFIVVLRVAACRVGRAGVMGFGGLSVFPADARGDRPHHVRIKSGSWAQYLCRDSTNRLGRAPAWRDGGGPAIVADALKLQRPVPDGALRVVAQGAKEDGKTETAPAAGRLL